MSTLSTFLEGLTQRVDDPENKLDSGVQDACLSQAIRQYSVLRPRYVSDDLESDGTAFLELPEAWQADFSVIARLDELDDDNAPTFVAPSEYRLVQNPAPEADTIFFVRSTPADGDMYRVKYALPHTVDAVSSTIPERDEDAVIDLAASLVCLRLADRYVQHENATLGTVQVDYKSKASEYRAQAQQFRSRFDDSLRAYQRPAGGMRTWSPRLLSPS